ncbi:hypothetical protein [Alkaliphilus crotonatoxidans]
MKEKGFFFAVFLLGFFFGLAFMMLLNMNTLERLYRTQNQLTNQLADREIKLEKLSESLAKEQAAIIKDLKLTIEFDGNHLIQEEIEKTARFYLVDLVGKEISDIDGELLYKILDKRIIEVADKRIKIQVKYIIVHETIDIGLSAKPVE